MKIFSLITGILLLIGLGYFVNLNWDQQVQFIYYSNKAITNINIGLIILIIAAYTLFAAMLIASGKILELKDRVKKHMRNSERANVESEEYSDKIKTLQAKIDTLEIALKESLSK
jgi:uncharacterized integral membrane protein